MGCTMNTKVIAVVLVVALVASGISTALFVLLGDASGPQTSATSCWGEERYCPRLPAS